ncbi:unnamed protein product [Brachionus calyciflorus]|uniref:C-type lectin n=1 Tax=Brachionus calyciflorus TaxID=104777 RepID=A0A814AA60_9BILA|nr:unnamed protein product [Brachionus calyciflorus]
MYPLQINLIFLMLFGHNCLESGLSVHFKANYFDLKIQNFSIIKDSFYTKISLLSCLSKCLSNEFCLYVRYEDSTCSHHTEFAEKAFEKSFKKVLYEKHLIKDNCLENPCKNSGVCVNRQNGYDCLCINKYFGKNCSLLNSFSCSKTNSFWSLKHELCIPCPANFSSMPQFPYSCFLNSGLNMIYRNAKLYCEEKNSTLLRLKSIMERSNFVQSDPNGKYWLDTKINYIGETFLWGDGSKIYGFAQNEPNNLNSLEIIFETCAVINNGKIFDEIEFYENYVVCQYSDSYEHFFY